MNLLTIPWRNSRRKWQRTTLLLAVFTLGVLSIVALDRVSSVVGESLERKLTAYGANILVTPERETLTVSYGGLSLGDMAVATAALDADDAVARIRGIGLAERVSAVAPKLVAMVDARSGAGAPTRVGLVGVRFDKERIIKNYWGLDGQYPDKADQVPGSEGRMAVLAGADVAGHLGLTPGSELELDGRPAVVTGVILPTGSDDDSVILADLGAVQDLAGRPGQADFVEVSALCSGCPIEDITAQIAKALPHAEVKALQSVVASRMASISFVRRLVLTVSVVILLTACSMIGLSMLSAVNERRREIGVLRSLGYSRGAVFGIFCAEALAVGLVSGLAGYVAGHLASFKVIADLDVAGTAAPPFGAGELALTCLFVALLSVLSSTLPALKAARIQPGEALVAL